MSGSCGDIAKLKSVIPNHLIRSREVRGFVESEAEELLWIAEVMIGSGDSAQQCVDDAIKLAQGARHSGKWVLPWTKRLLVKVALRRTSSQIRPLLQSDRLPAPAKAARIRTSAPELQQVRSLTPHRITDSCNVLERTCFILSGYLQYAPVDCALLIGCPRSWVEPISERATTKIIGMLAQDNPGDQRPESSMSTAPLVMKRESFLSSGPEQLIRLCEGRLNRDHPHPSALPTADLSCVALESAEQFQIVASDVLRSSKVLLWCILLAFAVLTFCLVMGL
jgi:hypothetical protein